MKKSQITRITRAKRNSRNIVVFDLETEPFGDDFRFARDENTRLLFAPRLRLGCTFETSTGLYYAYYPHHAPHLIAKLKAADKIVSFNGKKFDILVLQKHCSLSHEEALLINRKHIDLWEELHNSGGTGLKLNRLSLLNLNETKYCNGRAMTLLSLRDLEKACQSDVRQTYELFKLWKAGKLKFPVKGGQTKTSVYPILRSRGQSQSAQEKPNAPKCIRNLQNEIDQPLTLQNRAKPDPSHYFPHTADEMSKGQMAEMLALGGAWMISNLRF